MIASFQKVNESLLAFDLATLFVLARQRRYITVAIFSWMVIIVLLLTFLLPQTNLIVSNLQKLQSQEKQYQDLSAKVAHLRDVNDSEIEGQLSILNTALPSTKPVLPLLASLERLANENQVSVGNLELSPGQVASQSSQLQSVGSIKTKFPQVYALPLRFQLDGTFPNMSAFFKRLDELVPLIQVTTIHFSASNQQGKVASSSANYRADIELASLYSIPESGKRTDTFIFTAFSQSDQDLLSTLSTAASKVRQDAQIAPVSTGSARKSIFAQ